MAICEASPKCFKRPPRLKTTPMETDMIGKTCVADVAQVYGGQIVDELESNRAFYAQVDANLAAAWQASQEVGGVVDVTAASGDLPR